jgi:REP element-mobilizing transposase RayT
MFYRRHLPHWFPGDCNVFVTWRLAGSRPRSIGGPVWLQDLRIAGMIAETLRYGASAGLYDLHAWVIMPNHVHAIIRPHKAMARIMQWLKGRTARKANRILGHTGDAFWQAESFDHWIRSELEFEALVDYVQNNPVKAGLVETQGQWPWSSCADLADDKKRSSAPLLGTKY